MRYEDMLRDVLTEARGCPEIEAVQQMRNSCIEFCRETYCLTNGLQAFTGEHGAITSVNTAELWIVAIIDARIAGQTVDVVPMNDERVADATAESPVIVFADPSRPIVLPEPAAPLEVELLVAVAPGSTSVEVPDMLWQRYHEALTHGALARLLGKEQTPWYRPTSAATFRSLFQTAITKQAALSGRNRITRAQRLRVTPW